MEVFSSVCAVLETKWCCLITNYHKDLKSTLDSTGHEISLIKNETTYSLKGTLKAIVAVENVLLDFLTHLMGVKEVEEGNLKHITPSESYGIHRDISPAHNEKINVSYDETVSNDSQNCIHIELLSHVGEEESRFQDFCTITLQRDTPEDNEIEVVQVEGPSICKVPQSNSKSLMHFPAENSEHSNEPSDCPLRKAPTMQVHGFPKETQENSSCSSDAGTGAEFDCSLCSYKTSQRSFIKRHMKTHFNEEQKTFTQQFTCSKCTYKTTRKVHYLRHIRAVHNDLRPYLCDLCGKTFKRQDNLRQHRLLHPTADAHAANSAPFRCHICDKVCHSKAHLKEHQAVHSTARAFLCEICGASFKTLSVQRKHVNTVHRNPRSFVCHVCPKRFNTNFALRRHMKQHPSEIDALEDEVNDIPASQHEKVSSADEQPLG